MFGDPGSLPPPTIAGHTSHARQRLDNLTAHLKLAEGQQDDPARAKLPIDLGDAEDARDRLLLWAGNLGAMRAPISRLSLDSRLAEAPEIKELICQHLTDLWEAADDLSGIVKGDSHNHDMADDDGQGPPDEATMLLEIITESVSSLFRIAILVRKAGPDDRFSRALKMSKTAFPESFDINHAQEKYPKLQLRDAGLLANRVGSAISKRRQFIKYSRDHRYRLGHDDVEGVPEPTSTELLSSKASTFRPEMVPQGAVFSNTLGEQQEEEEEEDALSMTASTVSDPSAQVELPKLSDLSKDGRPFECPICFTLQCFQGESAWRRHAFRDLKAYVCTLGGKECHSQLFGDRNSWFEHELRQHRAQYACNLCNDGHLSSEQDLTAHVGTHHNIFEREQLQQLLNASRQTPAKVRASECPICDDWEASLRNKANSANPNQDITAAQDGGPSTRLLVSLSRFKRHVARHQEDLASFAVPRATENTGTSRRGSDGSKSTASISLAEWSPVASSPSPSQSPSRTPESTRALLDSVDASAGEVETPSSPVPTGVLADLGLASDSDSDSDFVSNSNFDSSSTIDRSYIKFLRKWANPRTRPTNMDVEVSSSDKPPVTPETTRQRAQNHSRPRDYRERPNSPPRRTDSSDDEMRITESRGRRGSTTGKVSKESRSPTPPRQTSAHRAARPLRPPPRIVVDPYDSDPGLFDDLPPVDPPEVSDYHTSVFGSPDRARRNSDSGVDSGTLGSADGGFGESSHLKGKKADDAVREAILSDARLTQQTLLGRDRASAAPASPSPSGTFAEFEAMMEGIKTVEYEKVEAEEELQRIMRDRLIDAGVPEHEIAAIMRGEKVVRENEKEAALPTFTRMSLKYLDLETLAFYKIDFELDPDPNYVLIKRWVPEWEQNMLWEHTRLVRSKAERGRRDHPSGSKGMLEVEPRHRRRLSDDDFKFGRRRSKSPGLLAYLAGGRPK